MRERGRGGGGFYNSFKMKTNVYLVCIRACATPIAAQNKDHASMANNTTMLLARREKMRKKKDKKKKEKKKRDNFYPRGFENPVSFQMRIARFSFTFC